jgi:putative transposase
MKVLRAYRTELDPTSEQRKLLLRHAGASRKAYNWGLGRKINEHQATGKSSNAIENHKAIVRLKHTDPEWAWLKNVSKCAPQEALRDLDRAFRNFLKGNADFPVFKSRKKDGIGSFRLTGSIKVGRRHIQLPVISRVRLKEKDYLPRPARKDVHILSVTASEKAGKWFVSLQVNEERPDPEPAEGPVCGIDTGTSDLATIVNEDETVEVLEAPKSLEKNLRKLKRLQRSLARKNTGSRNRERARRKVARFHLKISNIRKDAIHKATKTLATTKSESIVEDLNVRRMMRSENTHGNRHLGDAGLGEFYRQLDYKAEWYGSRMTRAQPSFPCTRKCSVCGTVGPRLPLSERTFRCQACGFVDNREHNAGRNLRDFKVFAVSCTESLNACQSREVAGRPMGQPVLGSEAGTSTGQA